MRRAWMLLVALFLLLVAGCGGSSPSGAPSPTETPTRAVAPPTPEKGACHQLTYDEAVATNAATSRVPCGHRHTAQTFHVGKLDRVVDGHLLAVDSDRVQQQVASTCPDLLAHYVGGSEDDLRLSSLRPVWFTPTADEAAAGANWFRCDVVSVTGPQTLGTLHGSLQGVLSSGKADEFALCGTARPGTSGFERVACSRHHSWRAISVVHFRGSDYPGQGTVESAGASPCKAAARAQASDTRNFEWAYDWPSADQWAAGQTYGICWAQG